MKPEQTAISETARSRQPGIPFSRQECSPNPHDPAFSRIITPPHGARSHAPQKSAESPLRLRGALPTSPVPSKTLVLLSRLGSSRKADDPAFSRISTPIPNFRNSPLPTPNSALKDLCASVVHPLAPGSAVPSYHQSSALPSLHLLMWKSSLISPVLINTPQHGINTSTNTVPTRIQALQHANTQK